MDIFHVFRLLGGLAMFLFGMDTMSKSLQKQAGGKLQKILGAFTGNPLKGFLLGMAVTAAIEAQLVETFLLLAVNHQSLIATKASRVVRAAEGRTVLEFGSRRAQLQPAASGWKGSSVNSGSGRTRETLMQ